jgi:ankyrin repeat protein
VDTFFLLGTSSEAKQKGTTLPFGFEDEDVLNTTAQSPVPSSEGTPDGVPPSVFGPSSSFSNLETIQRYFSLDSQDEVVTANVEEVQRFACTADDKGYTPLHTSAALRMASHTTTYNTTEIARLLLLAGANVACLDYSGNSPLHWAARAGDSEIAYLLILKSCPIGKTHNSRFVVITAFSFALLSDRYRKYSCGSLLVHCRCPKQ